MINRLSSKDLNNDIEKQALRFRRACFSGIIKDMVRELMIGMMDGSI